MFTSGFFDSVNGDRRYDAEQFGAIFDGIITDGVYFNVGNRFRTVGGQKDRSVLVRSGRAWIQGCWAYNDSDLRLPLPAPNNLFDRWDAVVLRKSSVGREISLEVVSGEPASAPTKPRARRDSKVYELIIAYVMRKAGTEIPASSDVLYEVGTSACPFVTSPVKSFDAGVYVENLRVSGQEAVDRIIATARSNSERATTEARKAWDSWFTQVQDAMSSNKAVALAARVLELETKLQNIQNGSILSNLETAGTGRTLDTANAIAMEAVVTFVKEK